MKNKYGDDLISYYNDAERIDNDRLLELKVDILSPCARTSSIDDSNASKINASMVCPGANLPVTSSAEKTLFDRQIISIPAFIANSGGVLGNKMEMTCVTDDFIKNFIRKRNIPKILRLIEKSNQLQVPMFKIAEEEAMISFRKMKTIDEEKIFKKSVNSAFIGTGLESYLKDNGIAHLVIVGLTTDHCVSTTTRMAGNLGFETILVSDATATFNRKGHDGKEYSGDEIHAIHLASLHDEFCNVVTTDELSK